MHDSELVSGLQAGDPAALKQLCEIHLRSLWRFVFAKLDGDLHVAEDIVGETMSVLFVSVKSLDPEKCNLDGWLRTVALNKVADHFRVVARIEHLYENQKDTLNPTQTERPSDRLENQERAAQVQQIMDRLQEQQRLCLEWKYIERLSVRDIAERLGLTEKAAESILFRARNEFRRQFEFANKKTTPVAEPKSDLPSNSRMNV